MWSPARSVRVVVTRLARESADHSFSVLPLSGPLQLHWQYPYASPQYPVIGPADHTCDLGYVTPKDGFALALYVVPNNFQGRVQANQRLRVEIRALADNGQSEPFIVEIAWDGDWSDDTPEMRRHLVLRAARSIDQRD